MKTKVITTSLLALALLAWSVAPALAQDAETMDPEMAAMMAKWDAVKTPGAQHKMLAEMVGKWDATSQFWMDPSQPPSEIKGVSEFKMILGGRYLVHELTAEWMGQPMHGMGITGYDNFRQEFVDLWMDDMGTGMYMSRGQANDKGDIITYKGTMDDPMTDQKDIPTRSVSTRVDKDTHKLEMFAIGPDGTEFKTMEVNFKRQK